MFPSEYVLRSFFSKNFFSEETPMKPGMRVLDIGTLYTNNLVPFHDRRLDLYGIEINEEMVQLAKTSGEQWNMSVTLKQGHNRSIPFPDQYFDILMSINTIHYENDRTKLKEALREFDRVGSSNCHYLIATAGSEHLFHKNAKRIAENQYRITTEDFRNGQIMAYFDDKKHFEHTLLKYFGRVEIVTVSETWERFPLQFWVAKCSKK